MVGLHHEYPRLRDVAIAQVQKRQPRCILKDFDDDRARA
jgi:hypothetical protein